MNGTFGNWGPWKILEELDLDMGFWGNDPAQVRDLLEPELMGIRVLPGDPLFEGKIDKIIEQFNYSTFFWLVGQICWKFWKFALGFWRVSGLVLHVAVPWAKNT